MGYPCWAIADIYLCLATSDIAATICGLFGYNEFVNWRNVMEIGSWLEGDSPKDMDVLADDGDSQHISDLALVFYTNALLLLH